MKRVTILFPILLAFGALANAQETNRITIIYDAFGAPSELERFSRFD